jgi:hypothetical protein
MFYKAITITFAVFMLVFEIMPNVNGEVFLIVVKTKNSDSHSVPIYQKIREYLVTVAVQPLSLFTSLDTSLSRREKLVHSSFRLKESVLRSLEIEAKKRGVKLSTLVNQTLENYITSQIHFEELGFLLVSKDLLRVAFENLDEKCSRVLGREHGLSVTREYLSFFFPDINQDNLVKFLDLWFKRYPSYKHKTDNTCHYFFIKHEINMNFSITLITMLEGLIEPIIKRSIEVKDLTPHVISFSFMYT